MFQQRIVTALILAPLAIAAVIWLPPAGMAVLSGLVFVAGFDEWLRLAGYHGHIARGVLDVALAVVFIALWQVGSAGLWLVASAIGCAWWLVGIAWLRHFSYAAAPTRGNSALKLVAGLFAIVPAWCALQWLVGHASHGRWLLFALFIVWAADVGAYLAGSRFGRRKLAPRISPGKTWAGVCGAFALGGIIALVGGWWLTGNGAGTAALIIVAIITIAASIVGDLVESVLKRHARVKDSGTIFPGHGGVLDRMDSVLAALPVFVLCLASLNT